MNIYVVVEGEVGEKQVYREWIPCVNPLLTYSPTLDQVITNNYYIVHGGGYPQYFTMIKNAIEDVRNITTTDGALLFNRLVISADSEENTYDEKRIEIETFITTQMQQRQDNDIDYKVIIQNFCLEAWCLGNRKIISQITNSQELLKYTKHYNVKINDPELLTPFSDESLTKAQHAEKYLRHALLNKHKNLTYNKTLTCVTVRNGPQRTTTNPYGRRSTRRFTDTYGRTDPTD